METVELVLAMFKKLNKETNGGNYLETLHQKGNRYNYFWRLFKQAIAQFSPQGKSQIALNIGDNVQIVEECGSWYRGITSKNIGIFPRNHVKLEGDLRFEKRYEVNR